MAPQLAALNSTFTLPFRNYYVSHLTRMKTPEPPMEGGAMAWNLIVSAALVVGGGIFAG